MTRLEDKLVLVKHATDTFGTVDILIKNAGLMLFTAWSDIAWDDWNKMVDVNIKGIIETKCGAKKSRVFFLHTR